MEYKRYENLRRKKCPIQTKNLGDTFRFSGISEIMKKAVGIFKKDECGRKGIEEGKNDIIESMRIVGMSEEQT